MAPVGMDDESAGSAAASGPINPDEVFHRWAVHEIASRRWESRCVPGTPAADLRERIRAQNSRHPDLRPEERQLLNAWFQKCRGCWLRDYMTEVQAYSLEQRPLREVAIMRRRDVLKLTAGASIAGLAAPSIVRAEVSRTLRFPTADLLSLDPVWTTADSARNHGNMVYDQLYGLDAGFTPHPQMVRGAGSRMTG